MSLTRFWKANVAGDWETGLPTPDTRVMGRWEGGRSQRTFRVRLKGLTFTPSMWNSHQKAEGSLIQFTPPLVFFWSLLNLLQYYFWVVGFCFCFFFFFWFLVLRHVGY